MVNERKARIGSAATFLGVKAACQNRSAERSPDPAIRQEDIGTALIAVVRASEMGCNSYRPFSLGPVAAGPSGNFSGRATERTQASAPTTIQEF